MSDSARHIVRTWRPEDEQLARSPRQGLMVEAAAGDDRFVQAEGPFTHYERTVETHPDRIVDVTRYRLDLPWFGWLLRWPVRATLRRRSVGTGAPPRWAPPDRLEPQQVLVLGLVAAASMSAAYVNTLFTQTANFAAREFGVGEAAQGLAGVIVRSGILIALPLLVLADRIGRRPVMVGLSWAAPILVAAGAFAPGFWTLTATQAIGRPLGIALDLLIAIVAAETMPRNSRAYALSILAMASGLGAGVAVGALPLADLGERGWRLVYLVGLVWLLVAVSLTRRLAETERFVRTDRRREARAPRAERIRMVDRRRFAMIAIVGFTANWFIAPASFFQNRYLDDVRSFDGLGIALFTFSTTTPASLGLVVGGRVADVIGRRRVVALAWPVSTVLLVVSFAVGGPTMWITTIVGGLLAGMAYPAYAVYRTEMFPTARRGGVGGLLAASSLLGGSVSLLLVGWMVDSGWSYGTAMAVAGTGQLIAAAVVLTTYPETAHLTLEHLNPTDALRQ